MNKIKTFKNLGLDKNILFNIEKIGFEKPTEIQERVIPYLLEKKHDIIGVAQTGTGKTAAFGLPLVNNIMPNNHTPKAIVLAPTRELALQISKELKRYSNKKLNLVCLYGGASINLQVKELKRGTDIAVGTPGRVLDLLKRRVLNLNGIDYFILDEADEMLNMGFIEDIESIFRSSNRNKRVLLFSATMPQKIKDLSKKYMKNQIIVETKNKTENLKLVEHCYVKTKFSEKLENLVNILKNEHYVYGIIFCRTKVEVENVARAIRRKIDSVDFIHGDIAQRRRERILESFRRQKITLLVATDVAARGIDVENLTHIINYSKPNNTETYTHRVGRTGRSGKKGIAISFLTPKEILFLKEVEKTMNVKFRRLESSSRKNSEKISFNNDSPNRNSSSRDSPKRNYSNRNTPNRDSSNGDDSNKNRKRKKKFNKNHKRDKYIKK